MTPRVLVVVTNFAPHVGGLERHVEEIFARIAAKGAEVTVVALDNSAPRRESYRGMTVVRMRRLLDIRDVFALPHPADWRRFLRSLDRTSFTHVSVHTRFFITSLMGVVLGRRRGWRTLHTEHGAGFVVDTSPVIRFASRMVDLTIGRAGLRRADQVLAVSQPVVDFVRELADRPSEIIDNGIETSFFTPAAARPIPSDLAEWVGDRHRVVFLGRLLTGKGWSVLLDALAGMDEALATQLAVIIVGDGPDAPVIADRIRREGLADRVRTLGARPPAEVRDLLNGAVYVNPSYLPEGFQNTVVEAASMNCWIISTPVPSAIAVLQDGHNGRMVAGRDTRGLTEALTEVAKGTPPINQHNAIAARFDWDHIAENYYEQLTRVFP